MDLLNTAVTAMGEAFFLLFQPQQLLFLMTGVVLGLWVGIGAAVLVLGFYIAFRLI